MKDIIEKAIKEAREKGRGKIISRDDIYNAILQAGIELVVEWIEGNIRLDSQYRGGNVKVREDWRAQKKVWFNEKV